VQVPPSVYPSILLSRALSVYYRLSTISRSLSSVHLPMWKGNGDVGRLTRLRVIAQGYTGPCRTKETPDNGYGLGDAPEGSACAFPFDYLGTNYHCTTKDSDVPWCYIDDGKWGNCNCTRGPDGGACVACGPGELRVELMSAVCDSVCGHTTVRVAVCVHVHVCCCVCGACVRLCLRVCVRVRKKRDTSCNTPPRSSLTHARAPANLSKQALYTISKKRCRTCSPPCSPRAGAQAHTMRWQAAPRAPPAPATRTRPPGAPRAGVMR
jgi:hypothetical protein